LKTFGNHTFWGGYDTDGTIQHFKIGKESSTTNSLMVQNYTLGEIVIRTGSSATNSNLGRNRIVTTSSGISIQRGGVTQGDQYIVAGIIGAVDPLNSHLYINGNGTNSIIVDSGIGSVVLWTNTVKIGNTIPINGKYANLQFKLNAGDNWETQSSAFTETIKNNILNASAFGGNKGKITLIRNFEYIGGASGATTLIANTVYSGGFNFNIGRELYYTSLYPTLFDITGKFIGAVEPTMNFSLYFELGFLCKNSAMRQFKSYIQIQNASNVVIDNSYTQGIHYRTAQTTDEVIYYNLGPLKHIISAGHQIILSTSFIFTTGSEGASTFLEGKFTIERNPL
jgi:hypothetical protein